MTAPHDVDRRQFLQATLAGAGASALAGGTGIAAEPAVSSQSESSKSAKPNIIFFMMDQLSAKWLEGGCAEACPTPNFDQLRAQGTSFTQTVMSNPVCCPSRATLATGLSTRGHGVLQNGYELDPEIPSFMRLLQDSGWRTGALGKVHFHAHYHGVHPDYRPYGFDVVHNTEDPRAGEWLDWVQREHPEHFQKALGTIWAWGIPELKQYGPDKIDLSKLAAGVTRYRGQYTLPFPEPVSQTAWITGHALDFIRTADPGRPIYAHISYVQPHGPFCPPAEYMDRIDTSKIPAPIPPEWIDDPHHPACFGKSESVRRRIPDNWRLYRQHYLADVAHLDHQLGLVIDALKKAGRWENTYLVLLADHGELFMDHGFGGKGERHYDACIRVPLVISGPGLGHGQTCDQFVQLEDVFPTVLEMAGLPLPDLPTRGPLRASTDRYTGRSLLPFCRGRQPSTWRESAYVESYNNIRPLNEITWARTVRTQQWRYTMYPRGAGEQLFDLRDDPDETKNLAFDAGYAAVRQQLRDLLLEKIIMQDYPHTPRECFSLGVH